MRRYRPQSDAPVEGRRLGTANTFLWVASDGLRITDDFDRAQSGNFFIAFIGAISIFLGLLGLYAGTDDAILEGTFWLVVGTALFLIRGKTSRKLRLNVRQGSLDWFPQSRARKKRRLVAHIGTIDNPYASAGETSTYQAPDGKWVTDKVHYWSVVIHTPAGTIRIGCFEVEESAVALGKLIACVLKYGNDPDARRRVLELPGVSVLLGPEEDNFLDPAGLPRLDLLPPDSPRPG
jgi:hypothetical protein